MEENGHGVAIVPSALWTDQYGLRINADTYRGEPLRERSAIYWDRRKPIPRYAEAFCEMFGAFMRGAEPHGRGRHAVAELVPGGVCGVREETVLIIGFDGQIGLEALRLLGLPEAAPAVLYACPSVPIGTRNLALETSWHLPSLTAGATANIDVTVPGARRGDFADASLDTSSIAFVRDCHVWSNNSVRVTARNVSASTADIAAAPLSVQLNEATVAVNPTLAAPCRRLRFS